jgi:hypothetical protein
MVTISKGEREPMATTFKDEEAAYGRWLNSNPHGYVVNTTRSPSAAYWILHRATCGSLRLQPNQSARTGEYIKVCSTSIDDLRQWARNSVEARAELHACGLCKP